MTPTQTDDAPAAVPEAATEVPGAPVEPASRGSRSPRTPSAGADGETRTMGSSRSRERAPRSAPGDGQRRPAPSRGFPRAERPAPVPQPEHHHLPGWVRRDFAKSRPALADLLGLLQGDERARLQHRVDQLTAGISEGKFSLAWQYPQIVAEGREAYERQRLQIAETQRAHRALETTRRRAATRLRDTTEQLGSDTAARLNRALRAAGDPEAISAVESEIENAVSAARTASSKRRDREIEKTRAKILRSTPRDAVAEDSAESWQDVLRRFADEQLAGSGAEAD